MKTKRSAYILVGLLCVVTCGCTSTHKSDREMIQVFQSHRMEFEKLLVMFQTDKGLLYFSKGRTRPENPQAVGITADRLKEYETLFSKLGLDGIGDVSQSGSKDEVWFFTSIKGSRQSTFKHYAYVMQPTRGIVQDLDEGASKSAPYRLIETHWYLALDDAD